MKKEIKVSASLFASKNLNLLDDVRKLEKAKCDLLHIDIMDGVFAPNIALGMHHISMLKSVSKIPLDVHFMIVNPVAYVEKAIEFQVEKISVHLEIKPALLKKSVEKISKAKLVAGIVVNPETSIKDVVKFLKTDAGKKIELITLMSVKPGYSGQKFIEKTYGRINELVAGIKSLRRKIDIQIDGGVGLNNKEKLIEVGVNHLVMGSSLMGSKNFKKTIRLVKEN